MLFPHYSRLLVGSSITLLSLVTWVGVTQPAKAINIIFNYDYDTNGFFSPQSNKDTLEEAASYFESAFNDTLDAITPSGSNTWSPNFTHPGTGQTQYTDATLSNLSIAANDVIVFAGGYDLPGTTLGRGGPGGYNASGNQPWFDDIKSRGETGALDTNPTDFAPWGGSITFDTATDWHFGDASTSIPPGETDFLSVAIHELGHLFGVGTADSWDTPIAGNNFTGAKSVDIFGGNVPLNPGLDHWANGTMSQVKGIPGLQEAALDPSLTVGERKLLTDLDYAGFDDLGWDVNASVYSNNVPFEFSPSLGIFFIVGMFGTKKVWSARNSDILLH